MKKKELVYRELLFQAIEKGNRVLTQAGLASKLDISLSTVNNALKVLERMNAVKISRMNFKVIDIKKICYYWASERNLDKDIIFRARINKSVVEIEKEMPDSVVFTAYSAYKLKFRSAEADYSEVYVYACQNEIEKRFKRDIIKGPPNLFILKKANEGSYGKTATLANLFVDLWNLREWYAKDFLNALEEKIGR